MIFKKFHKQEELNAKELDKEVVNQSRETESQDELEKRLQKAIRSQNRRRKSKSILLAIVLIVGLIGGFKSLFTIQETTTSSTAVNDYAFAEKYLSAYFKYPKEEVDDDFIASFTNGNWTIDYASNQVKKVDIKSVNVYQVTPVGQDTMEVYAHVNLDVIDKEDKAKTTETNVKVEIIHKDTSYLVNSPISMVYTDVSAMDESMKKTYIKDTSKVEGSDCSEQEKSELTNSVKLFLSTYNSDFTQAQLLMKNSFDLKPLDANTQMEFESLGLVKKDKENFNVTVTVLVKTGDVLMQRRNIKFIFEISSNKIVKMEEY